MSRKTLPATGTKGDKMKKLLMFLFAMFVGASYANTETINWFVDGNVYNTSTCQSGGDVNLPTQPTKRGHTFNGWFVAFYDFSTLDYTINATSSTYNAGALTWTAVFPYGTIYGKSFCSVTPGERGVAGTPDENTPDGGQCWCKATGYKPADSNIVYDPTSSTWVFGVSVSANLCAANCGIYCANYIQTKSAMRQAVFGITQ